MAFSMEIVCGGNNDVCMCQKLRAASGCNLGLRPVSLAIPRRSVGRRRSCGRVWSENTETVTKGMIVARSSMDSAALGMFDEDGRRGTETEAVEVCERLDEWIRKSVAEIVKNLKESPLLVQVYQDKRSGTGGGTRTTKTTLKTEKKAAVEDWKAVKKQWETGETPLPYGLIFVEEIRSEESEKEERGAIRGGRGSHVQGGGRSETATRAWGVVVQAKGMGCGPVCYLLKTCRVGAGTGLGLYCTHFILVRVKNFRETAQSQLKNCWLLQSQSQ